MSHLPIADYALLSNCHTAALVSREGSIDWLPFPRFDSPSVFGRLLDEKGGHFQIRPIEIVRVKRRYLPETLVLQTEFIANGGTLVLEDLLAVGENPTGHALGADSPNAVLRRITCTEGEVSVEAEYAPRPEYGLVYPLLHETETGILARGGASVLFLTSPVRFQCLEFSATAHFELRAGETLFFLLEHRSSSEKTPESWGREKIERCYRVTKDAWTTWSRMHQSYQGEWKEMVHHSGRVLQALTYYPTGAMVAAPTTSLPETVGGSRNWDYRFTWVRDASFTLDALWVAACPDESYRFFEFMAHSALTQVQKGLDMQIMFGVGGEHDLTEREIPHLSGWRDSRPVRIGNGAWNQRQLDVYGELLSSAHRLKEYLANMDTVTRAFFRKLADGAAARWKEKDHGIWEMRGPQRDFLYSKLMCWVALDRAIAMAGILNADDRVPVWQRIREEIRETILKDGWSERVKAFTQSLGSDDLDASVLMMPLVGFIQADDPRMLATIERIEKNLTDGRGLVYRYLSDDGLQGEEGTFLLCTFWLAHAYALAGRPQQARETIERCMGYANDVGLFSEEIHPGSGELIGNFPQGFSHIGFVNAAWALSQAETHGTGGAPPYPEAFYKSSGRPHFCSFSQEREYSLSAALSHA